MADFARRRRPLLPAALALAALAGCKTIDLETGFSRDEGIHRRILDQSGDAFPDIDPLRITDEVKSLVDGHLGPGDGEETRVRKLQDLLYGEEFLNIRYSDAKTHTAMEAFHARQGNCLSVMNLYVAMARHARVDASFQTVEVQPSWDRRGGLLVISQHINAAGRFSAARRYVVDFTPEISLQQLTSRVVSDRHARALYFNNLGVEAMVGGDMPGALGYIKNALYVEPELSIAWNNIGALYNRLGDRELAEYSYKMAFNADNRNAAAINNLAKFYRAIGDDRLAREYERAIERFNNRNPYYHHARGQAAHLERDLERARAAFRRALRLKEEEPDFHLALARVHQDLGDDAAARRHRDAAAELVALNEEIYRPSSERVRIMDSQSILRDSSPGISIIFK